MSGTDAPDNAALGELLCRAAEETERSDTQRRALRRAGRFAARWPVEARDMVVQGRSLTELRNVGPWLANVIGEWIATSPPCEPPPPLRSGFLTRAAVERVLATGRAPRVSADLQTHTLGSDGSASVEDMARAAVARGLEYVAITDHSKGLAIAGGMDESALARQGDEIERVSALLASERPGFRVLRAVEMNLAPTGEGDLDPAFLATLDLVLGAFHSKLRLRDNQTERYLAALRNPGIDVLAHPRGRIFNFRAGLTADWPRVLAAAAAADVAVEIDAYPDRQDLDVELLRLARAAGCRISIGSDAHACDQLAFLDYGIAAAAEAGIPEERIINCFSADALLAWTASRPRRQSS